MTEILERLRKNSEPQYASFLKKILPTLSAEHILGVRTPVLRKLAQELSGSATEASFLSELPHLFFEENQLHAFLIAKIRDFDRCMEKTQLFLPYIDNWATCDQFSPRVFQDHAEDLLPVIPLWLKSEHIYTIRFAINMLMQHFLDGHFQPCYFTWVAALQHEEYYVQTACAWYFATALAKHWEETIPLLTAHRLKEPIFSMTIRKARESRRITPEQKAFLLTLKQRTKGTSGSIFLP